MVDKVKNTDKDTGKGFKFDWVACSFSKLCFDWSFVVLPLLCTACKCLLYSKYDGDLGWFELPVTHLPSDKMGSCVGVGIKAGCGLWKSSVATFWC